METSKNQDYHPVERVDPYIPRDKLDQIYNKRMGQDDSRGNEARARHSRTAQSGRRVEQQRNIMPMANEGKMYSHRKNREASNFDSNYRHSRQEE